MVPSTLCAELAMAAEGKRRTRDTVYTCSHYTQSRTSTKVLSSSRKDHEATLLL